MIIRTWQIEVFGHDYSVVYPKFQLLTEVWKEAPDTNYHKGLCRAKQVQVPKLTL
jgi:hypothetical protein